MTDDRAVADDARGVELQNAGKADEALAFHERALSRAPRVAQFHHNFGNALLALDRTDLAAAAFERALAIDHGFSRSWNALGVVAHRERRNEDALSAFQRAIAIDPSYAEAHANVGTVSRENGDTESAQIAFLAAIESDAKNGRFYRYLIDGLSADRSSAFLPMLENARAYEAQMPDDQRSEFAFALAKVYEDARQFDRAWEQLTVGNRLRRAAFTYDVEIDLQFMQTMRQTFSQAFINAFAGRGNVSERPIFVLGMPRSGTTLVEQMLATLPGVFGAGELRDIDAAVESMQTDPNVVTSLRSGGDAYVRAIERFSGDRVVDKMPFNFRFVGLMHLMMPNARTIVVERDPLDTAFSIYATYFFDRVNFAYDLREIGLYYRAYRELMDHWYAVVPENRLLRVRYEDLVSDFEAQARRIVSFCELPWDDAIFTFHRTRRSVRTASHSQVRRPIYASAVGRSRPFAERMGPFADALQS